MKFKLVLIVIFTSLICGGIALGVDYFYDAVFDRLIASSLSMLLYDLLFGLTILAIPVAWSIINKLGVALIANLISSSVIITIGNQWNLFSWYAALIPGISYEVALVINNLNIRINPLLLGGIITTITTMTWDWYRNGYNQIPALLLGCLFFIRMLSILLASQSVTMIMKSYVTPTLED